MDSDADLVGGFDRIDHYQSRPSRRFPAGNLVVKWLKSGRDREGWVTPPKRDSQGGVVPVPSSEYCLQVWSRLPESATAREASTPTVVPGMPRAVRYADGSCRECGSPQAAEQVKQRMARWLAPRGLGSMRIRRRIV